ncbi:hypothetical protein [Streptomyces sp. NBC_01190]|uniref:hypothetical protein n=1 Tax=Streptomyces sp. NBC_01190 TaxID=2903767 RepID=UPI00386C80A0|nr:hypothetical protein OG519_16330 [Streptomyces sp. NBC_01190]
MPSPFTAIPLALIAILGYAALCALSPLGVCRRCGGFGFKVKHNRRGRLVRGRNCRRCRGYGQRVRVGRHLYNLATRLHREGNH